MSAYPYSLLSTLPPYSRHPTSLPFNSSHTPPMPARGAFPPKRQHCRSPFPLARRPKVLSPSWSLCVGYGEGMGCQTNSEIPEKIKIKYLFSMLGLCMLVTTIVEYHCQNMLIPEMFIEWACETSVGIYTFSFIVTFRYKAMSGIIIWISLLSKLKLHVWDCNVNL